MATKKKATKKKVKNGIHLFKNKDGEFVWNITRNGRILTDSGESYKRKSELQQAMRTAHTILADFYVLQNNKIFHDETLDK